MNYFKIRIISCNLIGWCEKYGTEFGIYHLNAKNNLGSIKSPCGGAMKAPEDTLILHIEDNPGNRLLVKRLLVSGGYKLVEAENARQAQDFMAVQTPDLILMDINLPGVDGYTLTSYFRTILGLRSLPIIAITANVMKGDRERVIQAGCDGYIEKPIDVDTFLDKIESFLSDATH
jgi:two-component system, cell cycle response regulator DivK